MGTLPRLNNGEPKEREDGNWDYAALLVKLWVKVDSQGPRGLQIRHTFYETRAFLCMKTKRKPAKTTGPVKGCFQLVFPVAPKP